MATKFAEPIGISAPTAFGRGRRSLERSIWYSGHLMTFLATGEDTRGQFALIELVARKGTVPPLTFTIGKKRSSMFWRAR